MLPSFLLKEALVDRHTYYFGWHDMPFACQPIQQCSRHDLIPKNAIPVSKA